MKCCRVHRRYVLLLTACVNPGGMPFTALTDTDQRLHQYLDALDFYLKETSLPIVFCENTGVDISSRYISAVRSGRLECLCFDGNHFDHAKGKGYGEALIMDYAFCHSQFLAHCEMVVKVTGRLKVENIDRLLRDNHCFLSPTLQTFPIQNGASLQASASQQASASHLHIDSSQQASASQLHTDSSQPTSASQFHTEDFEEFSSQSLFPQMIDSRLVMAPHAFWLQDFLSRKEEINDTAGFYFEHLLLDALYRCSRFAWFPFLHVPQIVGVSGTSGQPYLKDSPRRHPRSFMGDMLGGAVRFDRQRPCYKMPLYLQTMVFLMRVVCKLR